MSVVNVKRKAKAGASIRYQIYGVESGGVAADNEAAGIVRIAAMVSDVAADDNDRVQDGFAFASLAEDLAQRYGRKIQVRSLIQSFSSDEFDPSSPDDVQRVNELGYLLAKELHPNSYSLVITHVDGEGGHPHNHISVINHDNVTGKALRGNHLHHQVAAVNDRVMQREGARVTERSFQRDQQQYWEQQRDGEAVTDFDRLLGDRIQAALRDERSIDEASFRSVLAESGIELTAKETKIHASADGKKPEHISVGWTYKMLDEGGKKPRQRRRAASRISDEFTHKRVHEKFAEKAKAVPQSARVAPMVTVPKPKTAEEKMREQLAAIVNAPDPAADALLAKLEREAEAKGVGRKKPEPVQEPQKPTQEPEDEWDFMVEMPARRKAVEEPQKPAEEPVKASEEKPAESVLDGLADRVRRMREEIEATNKEREEKEKAQDEKQRTENDQKLRRMFASSSEPAHSQAAQEDVESERAVRLLTTQGVLGKRRDRELLLTHLGQQRGSDQQVVKLELNAADPLAHGRPGLVLSGTRIKKADGKTVSEPRTLIDRTLLDEVTAIVGQNVGRTKDGRPVYGVRADLKPDMHKTRSMIQPGTVRPSGLVLPKDWERRQAASERKGQDMQRRRRENDVAASKQRKARQSEGRGLGD